MQSLFRFKRKIALNFQGTPKTSHFYFSINNGKTNVNENNTNISESNSNYQLVSSNRLKDIKRNLIFFSFGISICLYLYIKFKTKRNLIELEVRYHLLIHVLG